MKYLLLTLTIVLVQIDNSASEIKYGSSLPAGKYRIKMKGIFNCNITTNKNMIRFNYYTFPKGNDTNEVRGNMTSKVPLDDTLSAELIAAFRDPNGDWIENVLSQKSLRLCSFCKSIVGGGLSEALKGLGFPELKDECRIPAGTYSAPGLEMSFFRNSNLPKTFIYGTYKIQFFQKYKNELYGCVFFIIEFKRA